MEPLIFNDIPPLDICPSLCTAHLQPPLPLSDPWDGVEIDPEPLSRATRRHQ